MKGLIGILILSAAILVGCGSGSSTSTGACSNPKTCWLTSVTYGAGVFVAVGSGGKLRANLDGEPWIETSTDGINWTPQDIQYTDAQLAQASILWSVTYGSNGFVTTDGVHVLHSTNGLNWSIESFQDTSNKISYVIYDGTRYILYSRTSGEFGDRDLRYNDFPWKVSADGVNWTDYGSISVTNGPAGEPVSIIHVDGVYEAAWQPAEGVGPSYLTATSNDGLSWTLGTPVNAQGSPLMYWILHTGDQYLVFGGNDQFDNSISWGVVLSGSSMSSMKAVAPLRSPGDVVFVPVGDETEAGNRYETNGLVSNGSVSVALGTPGLFVSTDGVSWHWQSMDGVVAPTGCAGYYGIDCTAFASGAAAPGGSIVVLVADGSAGVETTDGIHWVKSNL